MPRPSNDAGAHRGWQRFLAWYHERGDFSARQAVAGIATAAGSPEPEPGALSALQRLDRTRSGKPLWTATRVEVAELMWGEGFVGPGQALMPEFVKLMNLKKDSSVLNLGAETGGAAKAIVKSFGCYVTALEASPLLVDKATRNLKQAKVSRNATIGLIDFDAIGGTQRYDAIFAKEFFFRLENKTKLFEPLQERFKARGTFLLTDYVIDSEASRANLKAWADAEPQEPFPSVADEQVELLKQCNFDVRVVKDITAEYHALVAAGLTALKEKLTTHAIEGETRDAVMEEIALWARRVDAFRRGLQVQRILSLTL